MKDTLIVVLTILLVGIFVLFLGLISTLQKSRQENKVLKETINQSSQECAKYSETIKLKEAMCKKSSLAYKDSLEELKRMVVLVQLQRDELKKNKTITVELSKRYIDSQKLLIDVSKAVLALGETYPNSQAASLMIVFLIEEARKKINKGN